MEFSLKHKNQFPYIKFTERKIDQKKFLEKYSEWEIEGGSFWDKINKIEYHETPPTISFYDFSPVFENENDCDLMGLSKSRWHRYADELRKSFSIKTLPWQYEKEWRAIEISFDDIKEPEERIRHYPIEALTAIYFGIRTPNKVKVRINKILKPKNMDIQFFDCHLSDSRFLDFIEWQYEEFQ